MQLLAPSRTGAQTFTINYKILRGAPIVYVPAFFNYTLVNNLFLVRILEA